jgi:hypothetical protein
MWLQLRWARPTVGCYSCVHGGAKGYPLVVPPLSEFEVQSATDPMPTFAGCAKGLGAVEPWNANFSTYRKLTIHDTNHVCTITRTLLQEKKNFRPVGPVTTSYS